jgi:hypothetical protein
VYVGWRCFPDRKGLITSLIFTFNGLGSIVAAIASTGIVNPNDLPPTIIIPH